MVRASQRLAPLNNTLTKLACCSSWVPRTSSKTACSSTIKPCARAQFSPPPVTSRILRLFSSESVNTLPQLGSFPESLRVASFQLDKQGRSKQDWAPGQHLPRWHPCEISSMIMPNSTMRKMMMTLVEKARATTTSPASANHALGSTTQVRRRMMMTMKRRLERRVHKQLQHSRATEPTTDNLRTADSRGLHHRRR